MKGICKVPPGIYLAGVNKTMKNLPGVPTSGTEVQTRDLSNKKQECQPLRRDICLICCYATPSAVVMFSKVRHWTIS